MSQEIKQEKILEKLSSFQSISRKDLKCIKCGYHGSHGLASAKFFNALTISGLILCIVGFIIGNFIIIICSPVMIFFGIVNNNKFQCPNCELQFTTTGIDGTTKLNPIYKNN